MAKTNERLPVTFDSLVAAVRAETRIPEGAFKIKDFAVAAGISLACAQARVAKLVDDGTLAQGGPRKRYYWPA